MTTHDYAWLQIHRNRIRDPTSILPIAGELCDSCPCRDRLGQSWDSFKFIKLTPMTSCCVSDGRTEVRVKVTLITSLKKFDYYATQHGSAWQSVSIFLAHEIMRRNMSLHDWRVPNDSNVNPTYSPCRSVGARESLSHDKWPFISGSCLVSSFLRTAHSTSFDMILVLWVQQCLLYSVMSTPD